MKKTTILLVTAVFCGPACTPAAEKKNPVEASAPTAARAAAEAPVQTGATAPVAPVATSSGEYLNPEKIKINGTLPFETTVSALRRLLGKPDQIEKDAVECGGYFENDKGDFYTYGRSLFEVNGRKAVLGSIDFRSGKFRVRLGNQLLLDKTTTLAAVGKVYPLAYQKVSNWHDVRDGKTYQVLIIWASAASDDGWQFNFYEGRLVNLDYHTPC